MRFSVSNYWNYERDNSIDFLSVDFSKLGWFEITIFNIGFEILRG